MYKDRHCEMNAGFTRLSLNRRAAITILSQPLKATLILTPNKCLH